MLSGLEQELRVRAGESHRPMKFESGRMRTEDEQAIRPVGYIVQLGSVRVGVGVGVGVWVSAGGVEGERVLHD